MKDFMNDAADLASRAVVQDKLGKGDVAVYFYRESINLLTRTRAEFCKRLKENPNDNGVYKNVIINIDTKVQEYQRRINSLEAGMNFLFIYLWVTVTATANLIHCLVEIQCRILLGLLVSLSKQEEEDRKPRKSGEELELERAKFMVSQALREDEASNDEEAVRLYTDAVQLCLQLVCMKTFTRSLTES